MATREDLLNAMGLCEEPDEIDPGAVTPEALARLAVLLGATPREPETPRAEAVARKQSKRIDSAGQGLGL